MRRLTDSTRNGRTGKSQTEGGEMGRLMASPLAFRGSCVRWGRVEGRECPKGWAVWAVSDEGGFRTLDTATLEYTH